VPSPTFSIPGNTAAKLSDILRLEVEQAPTGLQNLVKNPSGELGGWGWVTPVAGSVLTGVSGTLRYTSPGGGASYFYTEPMPVAAGQYVAASWLDLANIYRAKIEWLDSSKNLLSSATQTGYITASGTTNYYGPYQAPASTAYARLRFDHYSNTSGANPTTGSYLYFSKVTVAKAATSGALGTLRTNLVSNPSMETNSTSWVQSTLFPDETLARTTSQFSVGAASLAITASASTWGIGAMTSVGTNGFPVTAGTYFGARAMVRLTTNFTASNQIDMMLYWYNSAGTYLGMSSITSNVGVALNTWVSVALNGVAAPASAAYGALHVVAKKNTGGNFAAGTAMYLDAAMVEQVSGLAVPPGAYFDGATPDAGGWDYGWTGTANNSRSTAATSNLQYIEPVTYLDILGSLKDLKWDREELNIGTLSGTVVSASLDPAASAFLRPGRRMRLTAYNLRTSTFEPLMTGEVTTLSTQYDETRTGETSAQISLAAVDDVRTLASATRPDGVAIIANLPYVLEGCGVPWSVNGSGNQVSSATVVSKNDNATAIDQIAITRDSNLGYAWMDRTGVLQAVDSLLAPIGTDNGSFEGSGGTSTVFSGSAPTIVAASTEQTSHGTKSRKLTSNADGATTFMGATVPVNTVAPGMTYAFTMDVRSATASRTVPVAVNWYDPAGSLISVTGGFSVSDSIGTTTVGQWKTFTLKATAPANAATATLQVLVRASSGTLGASEVHYFDNVRAMPVLDESKYSDLQVSFDSENCINSVVVKFLRYNPASQETTEVVYGPYEDAASIEEWGLHRKEFTVQDSTESAVEIAAFAQSVLTANAQPGVRINSVTLPINGNAWLHDGASHLDLYTLVRVENTARGISEDSRVTGISHTVTPDKWLVTLIFAADGVAATPQVTPPVQSGGDTDGTWIEPTLTNSWVNYDAAGTGFAQAAYMRKNGVVYLKGLVKSGTDATAIFTLPPGYRPAESNIFSGIVSSVSETTGAATAGTAHTHPIPIGVVGIRIDVDANGVVSKRNSVAANGYLSLSGISFIAEA
jgi:hypothetical protein